MSTFTLAMGPLTTGHALRRWAYRALIAILAAGLPLTTALVFVYSSNAVQHGEQIRFRLLADAALELVRREVQLRLDAMQTLRELMERGTIRDDDDFVVQAESIVGRVPGFIALNRISADRIIATVVPRDRNAAALGRRVGETAEVVAMLDLARSTGVPQATELVRLFQGGRGVATYYPISVRGEFAGYINGVIAIEQILGDVTRRVDPALQLAMSERRAPAGPSNAEDPGPYRLRRTIAVLNREWQLELSLASEVRRSGAELIQLALGILLSLLLFAFLLLNRREQQRSASARVGAERERRRLLAAIDSLPAHISLFDRDERLVAANQSRRQMFRELGLELVPGTPAERILAHAVRVGLPADASEQSRTDLTARRLRDLRAGDRDYEEEFDGRWYQVIQRRAEGGDTIVVSLDVTDRLRAQAAAAQKSTQLSAILDHAPFAIFLKDEQARYQIVNRRWQDWIRPAGTVIGQTSDSFFPRPLAEWMQRSDREVLALGKIVEREIPDVRLKDPAVTDVAMTKFPIRNADGAIIGVAGFAIDITARKTLEHRLGGLFEAIADGVILWDSEERLLLANRANIAIDGPHYRFLEAGVRFEEVMRRRLAAGMIPSAIGREEERLAERVRQFRAATGEPSVSLYDGDVWVEIRDFRTLDGGTVTVKRDVTARKRLEDQLRQSQKLEAIGQLTGGVAHDFNNLLAIVYGNLELLLEAAGPDKAGRHRIEAAMRAVQRGAELTSRLLAFARKQMLQPEPTDPNRLVQGLVAMLGRTLGEAVAIETRLGTDVGFALADPGQLETAIVNLAVNARDAMPRGGRLTIETAAVELDAASGDRPGEIAPGRYVVVTVRDTGTGMAPDVAARAFEPFFTTKEAGKGSGLGLSMVYGFARQSGGFAAIESGPGRGTAVKLFLPEVQTAETTGRPDTAPRIPHGTGQSILVVEDEPDVRELVCDLLEASDYRVRSVAGGTAALDVLAGNEPVDLLLTDVVLAGEMNGVEVAEAAARLRPDLKVLYMSGYPEGTPGVERLHTEGAPLISKPFTRAQLSRAVSRALKGLH